MLWVDQQFLSLDDLKSVDSDIADVCANEKIPTKDNSVIQRGIDETAQKILRISQTFGGGYASASGLTATHLAAVLNTGLSARSSRIAMSQVVVSDSLLTKWSLLKSLVAREVLSLIYRNAYNRTPNDRYLKKMEDYETELKESLWPSLRSIGIPALTQPLYAPGALLPDYGVFDDGNLSNVAGSGTATTPYDFAVTWVNTVSYVSPTSKGNAESGPSVKVAKTLENAKVARVDITNLFVPDGSQDLYERADCAVSPMSANGWLVYAGKQGERLYLQTLTPIASSTKTYTLPGDPVLTGRPELLPGQVPEYKFVPFNMRVRG